MASSSSSPEVEVAVAAMVVEEAPAQWKKKDPSEYILRKYLLMLATLMATVTYGVGFNPPGGVWQDSVGGHLAGEPIVRTTNNLRYLVFFYCNAVALASSVLVIVLFMLLSIDLVEKKEVVWVRIRPLRVLMVLDLLSFLGAYAAGSCRDTLTTVYTVALMAAGVSTYITVQVVLMRGRAGGPESPPPPDLPVPADQEDKMAVQLEEEERLRKVLMLLATFALSITYVSGLNSPGGFWDSSWGGHHPGDAILHKSRLTTFFVCNTTAFMSSLLIIMLLLGRKLHERTTTVRSREMLACVVTVLVGLVGAYAAGSCREGGPTAYVTLVVAAGLVCLLLRARTPSSLHKDEDEQPSAECAPKCWQFSVTQPSMPSAIYQMNWEYRRQLESARSLLLLLATFATAITYPAGLDPPGGVWQDNNDGHLAGDPILLTSNAIRYKLFFYCNSIAFVTSLYPVVLLVLNVQKIMFRVHVEPVIMLELFGLVGAYAAGACRDISTSIYVMALGGAVQFYVVIHVIFFTLGHADDRGVQELMELDKKRKLLYLLATLSTAVSYQAGLNPPAGFWLQDDDDDNKQAAGSPVLLYNHPGRYHAFFYCNSLSFMLSVTTMILLMSRHLYRPAMRSGALTLCTVAGLSCLMGAYAAGSTQHLTTSIGIFVLMSVAFLIVVLVFLIFFLTAVRPRMSDDNEEEPDIGSEKANIANLQYTKQRKKLMLMAILVAGVTYQAGLDPPGGVWQSGASAGGPVMQDNRKQRYLAFFYSNSTSFAASIIMLLLLLLHKQQQPRQQVRRLRRVPLHIRVLPSVVILNLLALLVAYTAGSSRDGRSSLSIAALVIALPAYIVINMVVSSLYRIARTSQSAIP